MTTITNRIVTRGLGPSRGLAGRAGPVTMGYGGPPTFVTEAFVRRVHGRSGHRYEHDLHTVMLWARLVEVNGRAPDKKIEGSVRVPYREGINVLAERVAVRARDIWRDVKITVKRIKR